MEAIIKEIQRLEKKNQELKDRIEKREKNIERLTIRKEVLTQILSVL